MPGVRTSNSRTPGKCNLASATRQRPASGPFASLDAITFSFQRSKQAACAVTLRHRGRACFRPGTTPGQIFQQSAHRPVAGGADRNRTDDLRLAKPALSQLSYSPCGTPHRHRLLPSPPVRKDCVGQGRFELPTSRLSGVRSNQLSYWPGRSAVGTHTRPSPARARFARGPAPSRSLKTEPHDPHRLASP
jgi:hypothetical protein